MANVKFKISYDQGRNFVYSKIKSLASDQNIYKTASAFARLRNGEHESIYKIIETDITE